THGAGAGALRQLGESLHRHRGPGDGRRGEPAGAKDLLAQADGSAILGQHLGAPVRSDLRDLQAHGVRAEVDDGEDASAAAGLHAAGPITKSWMEGTSGCTSTGRREWSVSRWTTTASGKLCL